MSYQYISIDGGLRKTRLNTIPDQTFLFSQDAAGAVTVLERGTFQSRARAVLSLIMPARSSGPLAFLVNTYDKPKRKYLVPYEVFGVTSLDGYPDIPAPDFVFGGWPEAGIEDYDASCQKIEAAGSQPALLDKVGWYGNCTTAAVRDKLVAMGKACADKCEFVDTSDWHAQGKRINQLGGAPSGMMTMPGQAARFAFLIDVEGVGYSGRVKMLLHSGRPLLLQERPWKEWFFPQLKPWVHYAPVKRDLSDLFEVIETLRNDRVRAAQIGAEGRNFARRHLTRAGAVAKWRDLLARLAASPRPGRSWRRAIQPSIGA